MAAPNNAYRNKSLWMRGGTTNYEHKVAILQEDKATMLERFYLDDLVAVKVDGTNDGVIGAVIIGGDNEKMHNITTRGGVGRVRVQGQTARLLNDAGLNTLGLVINSLGVEYTYTNWMIVASLEFKSAYDLETTEFGIEFKKPTDSTWLKQVLGTFISPNSSVTNKNQMDIVSFSLDQTTDYQTRFY